MKRSDSFQFLKALSKRSKAVRFVDGGTQGEAFLGLVIGKRKYYISVGLIKEIIPEPQITAVAHAKPWLTGLLKVQGEIYSIIDMSTILKEPDVEQIGNVVVALSIPDGNYAILVSAILGIEKPAQLTEVDKDEFIINYQTAEKQRLSVLSLLSVVESPEFSNMSIF